MSDVAESAARGIHPRLLFHTVRHLRPSQIIGRFARHLPRRRADAGPPPPARGRPGPWVDAVPHGPSLLDNDSVVFLAETGEIAEAWQWNDPARARLWLYNLHYFDGLSDAGPAGHRLATRWIVENPQGVGVGWEPYPLSRRIANWILADLAGAALPADAYQSLAEQTRYLDRRIEWHLLGNHLLANAKALTLAGLFFEGREADRWLARGLSLHARQLPEQILADGGHFERSPMYHALVLEDLLDVANALRCFGREADWQGPPLTETLARMLAWLEAMTHGDGEIAYFNDAAQGIAARPADIAAYAACLDVPATDTVLGASGYVRMQRGDAVLICDVGEVGPAYQPGHAHADTLSFELSLGAERVVVNRGVSRYGVGPERSAERGTAAHSTVVVDGADSSEVWHGFRVARRARPYDLVRTEEGDATVLACAHDGYRRLPGQPRHHRRWRFAPGALTVDDTVQGRHETAVVNFHLGPGVVAVVDGTAIELTTATGRRLQVQANAPLAIEPSRWHPGFGQTIPTRRLVATLPPEGLSTRIAW